MSTQMSQAGGSSPDQAAPPRPRPRPQLRPRARARPLLISVPKPRNSTARPVHRGCAYSRPWMAGGRPWEQDADRPGEHTPCARDGQRGPQRRCTGRAARTTTEECTGRAARTATEALSQQLAPAATTGPALSSIAAVAAPTGLGGAVPTGLVPGRGAGLGWGKNPKKGRPGGALFHVPADMSAEGSVAVVLRLERTFHRHAQVVGLFLREPGQPHADLLQVQARDFLVELLRQDVDLLLVGVPVGPQVDLRQRLVVERVRHHKTRMPRGAAQLPQATLSAQ